MRTARSRGFSLIEVLVALAILGLSLPVVLAIFSTGLRSSARAEEHYLATRLAESKLTELAATAGAEPRTLAGTFSKAYRWRASVKSPDWWVPRDGAARRLAPYEITVQVSWFEADRERSVTLTTLRLAERLE